MTDKGQIPQSVADHTAQHQRVWANLPWYVNDTLHGDERAEVQAHLAVCLSCRREHRSLERLRHALTERVREPRCEAALARLHAQIDDASRPVVPWAAAAVLVVVTALAALIGVNSGVAGGRATGEEFLTLGLRTVEHQDAHPATARVVFARDVTELQLRELLLAVDAEVIHGPTARGAYTIAIAASREEAAFEHRLEWLRASRRVLFVEPILAGAGRERRD